MPQQLQDKYDECKKNTDEQTFNNDILDAAGEIFERQYAEYFNAYVRPLLQVKIVWPTAESRPAGFKEDLFTNINDEADNNTGKKEKKGREKQHVSYYELDDFIKDELENFDHMPYNYEPDARFYIAETNLKQIVRAYAGHKTENVGDDGDKMCHR
jgi:hypothetical protein